ncbi:MAG: hypothetical protein K940chlam2_01152 [Chlamydiae bacterium]|nr:hypothetical protein [Chlamydiota bacterium]
MKYITALLLFLCCQLSADPMCKKIESIKYSREDNNLMATIILSDGTSWRWAPDIYSEGLLIDWQLGDEVVLQQIDHPGFALHNLTHPRYAPIVALRLESLKKLATVASIEGGVVKLNDETLWQPAYATQESFLKSWRVGDRILITKSLGMDRELINVNIPYTSRCVDMRTLAVWPYFPPVEEAIALLEEEPAQEN